MASKDDSKYRCMSEKWCRSKGKELTNDDFITVCVSIFKSDMMCKSCFVLEDGTAKKCTFCGIWCIASYQISMMPRFKMCHKCLYVKGILSGNMKRAFQIGVHIGISTKREDLAGTVVNDIALELLEELSSEIPLVIK